MTHHNQESDFLELLSLSEKQKLQANNPPATPADVEEVASRALASLGVPLASEYLQLVQLINGGGYNVCFYPTRTRQLRMLKRDLLDLGIVEQNIDLRKLEVTDKHELAYAQGEGGVFLPGDTAGTWVGRDMTTRQVLWRFGSFHELVRYTYG
jgi:hypothetical protein